MKGRASTLQPKPAKGGTFAPVKKGRFGDFQPNFMAVSNKHANWLRKIRRFQAYLRFVQNHDDSNVVHGTKLWGSIGRARGSAPSFPAWWIQCSFKVHGSPASVPVYPPPAPIALALFEGLVLAFRDLEHVLMTASRQYAKFRRQRDPNVVFRDLKDAPAQGIEILVRSTVGRIVAVNALFCCA